MNFRIELCDRPCGILTIESERFSFCYLDEYQQTNGPPLSVIMPVAQQSYPDNIVFPFFENLLPEGRIRQLVAARLKTPENNFTRLLERLGGDVAGAISIYSEDSSDATDVATRSNNQKPERLTRSALGKVLKSIEISPFLVDRKEKVRLSLAGAQNKLPVIIVEQQVYLPATQPSTHIIKPPSQRFAGLVQNEYLCMRAAATAGINVPEVALIPFISERQEQDCYAVTRFDRKTSGEQTTRLHQEDFCQILSVPSAQKYTRDGGPGFKELFDSVRRYTVPPAIHQTELLRRILFNILIGNNDAHGKNFSVLHRMNRVELAPAYDLVCTQAYAELEDSFAMPVGNSQSVRELDGQALQQFELTTGINLKRQAPQLRKFIDHALRALMDESAELKQNCFPDTVKLLGGMEKIFTKNHRKLMGLIG